MSRRWNRLQEEIVACARCPRLRDHCEAVARQRRRMYRDQEYWGQPVPSFGGPPASLLIVGLAPAAHGANRTGRMFTGDSSGDWLYEALHRFGFANQPSSTGRDDGLVLSDCVVTATNHCAPPGNKPTLAEQADCRPFLQRELEMVRPRLVLVLGRIAWEGYLRTLHAQGLTLPRPRPPFRHNHLVGLAAGPPVLQSYHPSRQNTNTGRLTRSMWHAVFRKARQHIDGKGAAGSA